MCCLDTYSVEGSDLLQVALVVGARSLVLVDFFADHDPERVATIQFVLRHRLELSLRINLVQRRVRHSIVACGLILGLVSALSMHGVELFAHLQIARRVYGLIGLHFNIKDLLSLIKL